MSETGAVTCSPGEVATSRGDAVRVEVDGSDVYFTVVQGRGNGLLLRTSVDTPGEPVVVVDGLTLPGDFTIADGALYVTDYGRIQRLALDGSSGPTTVYTGEDVAAFEIVADDSEMVGGVACPVDPMERLQCESCQ